MTSSASRSAAVLANCFSALLVGLCLSLAFSGSTQEPPKSRLLSADDFRNGSRVLRAFVPVADKARDSVVSVRVDGAAVALGTVIDTNGLVLTKASEVKREGITCRLANGDELKARLLNVDDENDVALLKIDSGRLKPVQWTTRTPAVGQWVVTPGINEKPEAIGIVSVPERKILHKRALIGIVPQFPSSGSAKIAKLMKGLGAEKAGLKPGDIIVAVNDHLVMSAEDLIEALRTYRAGQIVTLKLKRDEEEFTARVEMMIPPDENGPGGLDRQDLMNRFGAELSGRAEGFELALQHDTVLQPWQCGGPLVNLDGKAIGMNIARAGRIASYGLPASLVKQIIERLKVPASDS